MKITTLAQLAELDRKHDAIGLGSMWQASVARQELLKSSHIGPRFLIAPHAPPMPARRTLVDGCAGCGLSVIACHSAQHQGETCCALCRHP